MPLSARQIAAGGCAAQCIEIEHAHASIFNRDQSGLLQRLVDALARKADEIAELLLRDAQQAADSRIPKKELARHVQLVLTDRSQLLARKDYGVVASSTWRLADLSTKYALLKDGVGWGSLPLHMVEKDIAAGALVILDVDVMPRTGFMLVMSAVHPASAPPGPAGRWLVDYLKD